jgi:phosphoribosylformylglycinamidine synthase subunit PurQ / glutaminase
VTTVAVLRFPGSNCDADARHAVEAVLGARVRYVWHTERELGDVDAVVVPGGFSYGDYLRSGALAATSPVMDAVRSFARRGGPVLGICNGFQILTESGLLPGALARNAGVDFVCDTVNVRLERTDTPFTGGLRAGDVLALPIAHHEGRYVADPQTLDRLEGDGLVVLRYVDASGARSDAANPNGSERDIAGIVDERGTVMGMMPHPERAVEALLGSDDGRTLLASMIEGATAATNRTVGA